jgi:hypothetical protein
MKKTLFGLTAFFWVPYALNAQITITASNFAAVTTTVSYVDTVPAITPGSAGAGVTWDFSALHTHRTVTNTVMTPTAGVMGSSFPSSNMCVQRDTNYLYLDTSNTKVEFWGVSGHILGNGVNNALVYTNPQTILTFPSTYTTTFKDTATYDRKFGYNAIYQGVQVDSLREKERIITSSTMDGWGWLTTPSSGAFSALRQNVLKKSVDSTWAKIVVGSYHYWTLLYGDTSNTRTYTYMTNVSWGPEVEIEYYADSTAIYEVRWSGMLTGVAEQTNSGISVYPNPASNYITIANPTNENITAAIYDLTGREVMKADATAGKAIAVTSLQNGTYLISVLNKEGVIKTGKIIIIH